jgi:hypothetical protein
LAQDAGNGRIDFPISFLSTGGPMRHTIVFALILAASGLISSYAQVPIKGNILARIFMKNRNDPALFSKEFWERGDYRVSPVTEMEFRESGNTTLLRIRRGTGDDWVSLDVNTIQRIEFNVMDKPVPGPVPRGTTSSVFIASPGHNAYLFERGRLTSPSGNFTLLMQTDGNLVLYKSECVENPSCAVWDSRTFREQGQYYLAMQDDGNLVIYRGRPPDDAGKAIWATRTDRTKSNYFLSLQDDGSLVICIGTGPSDNKGVIWSSK